MKIKRLGFQTAVAALLAFSHLIGFSAFAARYSITLKNNTEVTKDIRQLRSNLFISRDLNTKGILSRINSKLNLPEGQIEDVLESSKVIVANYNEAQGLPLISEDIGVVEREVFRPLPRIGKMSLLASASDQAQFVPSNLSSKPWGLDYINALEAQKLAKSSAAKVLILDSGITINHPQFEKRIKEVRDFTGENGGAGQDNEGHGTHVAGTVAGLTVGVFPNALIYAGKVCGSEGCSNIAIAQGLEWAAKEKLDVVNLSLGGGQLSAIEKRALDAAESAGVTVIAASGNDGRKRVSFPGAYQTAFSVGAIDQKSEKAKFSNWGPELDITAPGVEVFSSVPLQFAVIPKVVIKSGNQSQEVKGQLFPESPKMRDPYTLPLVFSGLGKPQDFQGKNIKGKAALIQRGDISFAEKFKNALVAGASAVVFFNNEPGLVLGQISPTGDELTIPVLMVEKSTGEKILSDLASGSEPALELSVNLSDFDTYSGTSMASPHVAGVATMMKAVNPKLKPSDVRRILTETATQAEANTDNQFGAGVLNAEKAVAKAIELR